MTDRLNDPQQAADYQPPASDAAQVSPELKEWILTHIPARIEAVKNGTEPLIDGETYFDELIASLSE